MRKAMIYAVLGVCCAFAVGVVSPVMAETKLQPFVLAFRGAGTVEKMVPEVKEKLAGAGLVIVGAYEPYKGAYVVVVTTKESQQTAGLSEFGGYGAAQRVSLTQMGEDVQTVYTNPAYMAAVYRMDGDLAEIAGKLKAALGSQEYFGSKKGLAEKKLRKYHYMAMMPYFDDHNRLASFESHAEAVEAVEKGLEKSPGVSTVYRIDMPGKEEVLFGVAIGAGKGADEKVMGVVDTGTLRHTAHLPYEVLVSGGDVFALHGKFRIALSFPDLGMGTFMKISGAPGGIKKALKEAVKGE
jgi:hypothetical protein